MSAQFVLPQLLLDFTLELSLATLVELSSGESTNVKFFQHDQDNRFKEYYNLTFDFWLSRSTAQLGPAH